MATDLSGQSTTPASNTTISGVSIAEGCAPSNINDAQRAMIAQSKGALLAVTSAGTNTITATYAPVPDAYVSGWRYPFKAGGTNTGAATFDASPGGVSSAKAIKKTGTAAVVALTGGEIVVGGSYELMYDGTAMILSEVATTAAGKIAQIVSTQTGTVATALTTAIPHDNTIPQITEGDQVMSRSITPTNPNSTLLIDIVVHLANNTAGSWLAAALFQDSTAGALAALGHFLTSGNGSANLTFRHKMTAGTTSATTFTVRIGADTGTTTFNGQAGTQEYGGVLASSITITEVLP